MHKKSFRLFISTLLFSFTAFLGGCGSTVKETVASSHTVEETSEDVANAEPAPEPSRFVCENVNISTPIDDNYYSFFDYSFLITDSKTGKQYLYLYHDNGYDGGPVMVELGTTVNTNGQ